jgi:predicted thioesterase
MKVKIDAKIAEVKGRAVTFEVSAHDGIDQICRCKHGRFVVDLKQTESRLAAKAQKAKQLGA